MLKTIEDLAGCGVTQAIIAEYLGIVPGTFASHLASNVRLKTIQAKAAGRAKEKLIRNAYEMALLDKNVTMTIFLLKARCGFRENTADTMEEVGSKAQLARETLDRMGADLARFQAPDGAFVGDVPKKRNPVIPTVLKKKLKAPKKKKRGSK